MRRVLAIGLVALTLAGACGDDDDSADATGDRTLTVFAASSLTNAMGAVGAAFEDAHQGVEVTYNFAASSALREQILSGAPADVFASANQSNVDKIVEAGEAAGAPRPFANNRLAIAVPKGNPKQVSALADFAKPELLIGLCAEEVPCGDFGREALQNAGVTPSVDTNESDVRSLLTKVLSGDLDAGIVYHTDTLAAADTVEEVQIPDDVNVVATYPIVALKGASDVDLANEFIEFVLSDDGQSMLESFGFERS